MNLIFNKIALVGRILLEISVVVAKDLKVLVKTLELTDKRF